MQGRKLALVLGIAASCAGCVTETKSMKVSAEVAANLKDVKEEQFPKRDAHPHTWVAVGEAYEAKAQDEKTASANFEAKSHESNVPPAEQSALLAQARKAYQNSVEATDEARKAYQKAIQLDSKCVAAHIHLANLYLHQDDPERASAIYQQALKQNPKSANMWYELGMVHCGRKDLNGALPCLAKAHELDSNNHLFATQYGLLLARVGRPQEGVTVLCKVMNKAEANYNVARMMEHVNQHELSRQYLQVTLNERPTHPGALAMLAQMNGSNNGFAGSLGAPQFDSSVQRASYRPQ